MGDGRDTSVAVTPLGTRAARPGDEELALATPVDTGLNPGQGQGQTQDDPRSLPLSSSSTAAVKKSGAIRDARIGQQGNNGQQQQQQQQEEVPKQDPPGRYRVLAITTTAVVFGLATWFSATAVR